MTQNLRGLLLALSFWMLVVLIIYMADWYFLSMLRGKAELLKGAKSALTALETKRASLTRERDRIKERDRDIERVQDIFVDSTHPLTFVKTLEGLTKGRGITLILQLPQKRKDTLTMRLGVEGGLQGVMEFIKDVERLPQQIIFEEFSLEIVRAKESAPVEKPVIITSRASGLVEFLAR